MKMNKVYHLVVEAYSTRFGSLREPRSHYADLYMTHEEAYNKGKEVLGDRIGELYEASDYCTGQGNGEPLWVFLDDKKARYRFLVTEIDLDVLKTYDYLANHRDRRPAHMEYEYDFNGDLLQQCRWYYADGVSGSGSCYQYRDGDDLPEAGTKFKRGDFVRLRRPLDAGMHGYYDTDTVFVVIGEPRRGKDGKLQENIYSIETVSKHGEYQWDLDFHYPFQGIHETELVGHEGEVDKNSPLWFLHKVICAGLSEYKNYDELEKGIIRKLEKDKILLTPDITWRDIPELAGLGGVADAIGATGVTDAADKTGATNAVYTADAADAADTTDTTDATGAIREESK